MLGPILLVAAAAGLRGMAPATIRAHHKVGAKRPAAAAPPSPPAPPAGIAIVEPAEKRLPYDGQTASNCATGRLIVAPIPPEQTGGFRAVATDMQIGVPEAAYGKDNNWLKCRVAHLTKPIIGEQVIARVIANIHYRLARRGTGQAQLVAYVNGVPGIAVATDQYGEGVLPIIVPGDRFLVDKTLDITLILQADRLESAPLKADTGAGVSAEVRDVIITVVRTTAPQAPPAAPGTDTAKPAAAHSAAGPPKNPASPAKKPAVAPPKKKGASPPPKKTVAPPAKQVPAAPHPPAKLGASAMTIYDLGRAEALLADRWTMRGAAAVIPIQQLGASPRIKANDSQAQQSLTVTLPLRDKVTLGGRETRVTLVWSALKEGWAEGGVELDVNGIKARSPIRAVAAALAGQRLLVRVPAVSVRAKNGLTATITVRSRQRGVKSRSTVDVDALEVEVAK